MDAQEVTPDYDVRGRDLRQYYAGFGRRVLPDSAVWNLSMASSVLPDGHPGYMAWITTVADANCFCLDLQRWAIGLGGTIAGMKPKLGKRRREFVRSYKPEWGDRASLDGLMFALWGKSAVPSTRERAEQLGCDREAYARLRDFVAGAILLAMWQYEDALRWAFRQGRH